MAKVPVPNTIQLAKLSDSSQFFLYDGTESLDWYVSFHCQYYSGWKKRKD